MCNSEDRRLFEEIQEFLHYQVNLLIGGGEPLRKEFSVGVAERVIELVNMDRDRRRGPNPGSTNLKRDMLESGEPDIHAAAAVRRLADAEEEHR